MSERHKFRAERLIYYAQDITRINAVLDDFMRLANAKCTLLIDKEGHMIAQRGDTKSYDLQNIAALAAGSFAATKEMAKLLGEDEFNVLFHQGEKDNLQLGLVGDRLLMAILFDDRTTIGMVRLYAREATERLAHILADAAKRKPQTGPKAQVDPGYTDSAKKKLDEFFKG